MRLVGAMTLIGCFILAPDLPAQGAAPRPAPRTILLDTLQGGYAPVLTGPPATVTMRSGRVTLAPGQSVGRHSTEDYEEAVIVLSGTGEMRISGGPALRLSAHTVAYCPPATEHDVVNTGGEPLRYIYLVARAPSHGAGAPGVNGPRDR